MSTCARGIGQLLFRAFLRPLTLPVRQMSVADTPAGSIEIFSATGSLLGRIRTDCQNSIIRSVVFNYSENGCAELTFELSELPKVDILFGSIIKFKALNTSYGWFKGTIKEAPQIGTERDIYQYRCVGFIEYLSWMIADVDYPGASDPGEIAADIIENWIAPYSPIGYNPAKISTDTGTVTTAPIELSRQPIDKVLQFLADYSGAEWGVDGDGDAYFRIPPSDPRKTLFEGYGVRRVEPEANYDSISNVITILRQEGRGAGSGGWLVAGVYTDETSIAKYGRRELDYTVPAYLTQADADAIGASLISRLAEPQQSLKIDGVAIETNSPLWLTGDYRFILDSKRYWAEYDIVDESDDWQIAGLGDLVLSESSTILVAGAKSLKADFDAAQNQEFYLEKEFSAGKIHSIRFFIRASTSGVFLYIGAGVTTWDENLFPVTIAASNRFFPVEIDLSSLNIRKIGAVGFKILQDMGATTTVYVDRFTIEATGSPSYRARLGRHGYKFTPGDTSSWAEFGPQKPRLENYIKSLDAESKLFKFTQELR